MITELSKRCIRLIYQIAHHFLWYLCDQRMPCSKKQGKKIKNEVKVYQAPPTIIQEQDPCFGAPLVSGAGMNYVITLHEHWEEELQTQGHTQRSQSSVFLTVLYRSELGKCIGTHSHFPLPIFIHQQPEFELKFHNLKLNPGSASRKWIDLSLYQDN